MKIVIRCCVLCAFVLGNAFVVHGQQKRQNTFDMKHDLLLAHYDFKTDVDDLHAVAALASLLAHPQFSKIHYHAVAGTYGMQEGLYVPPNALMQLAFGSNWSDADKQFDIAVERVSKLALKHLKRGGRIWIAEGGQSDFTAAILKKIREGHRDFDTSNNVVVVQHSDWNETVTSAYGLNIAKKFSDYQKIADGNADNNGTPNFRSKQPLDITAHVKNQQVLAVWQLAIEIANRYNGVEGRYLNEAIKAGGLDFSDFVEVCWILGVEGIKNAEDFFMEYVE